MPPLVSILIPAYNAERWIGDTIQSALAQTWPRVEIIIVDDGSRDRTLQIARQFASKTVSVATQENQGASAARNKAFELSQGDYIQWLDADDLLAPDKIAKQMETAVKLESKQTLLSSAWSYFIYSCNRACFVPTSLWHDLKPAEWLIRKMGQNLQMPPATWLVSRELTQAVPGSVSDFDQSEEKLASLFLSMQLHVQYLRSLEDSERIRAACLSYLQRRFFRFYPEHKRFVDELQQLAGTLGGRLENPRLPWKYSWMPKILGWTRTKRVRQHYNQAKWFVIRLWDKALFCLDGETVGTTRGVHASTVTAGPNQPVVPRTNR